MSPLGRSPAIAWLRLKARRVLLLIPILVPVACASGSVESGAHPQTSPVATTVARAMAPEWGLDYLGTLSMGATQNEVRAWFEATFGSAATSYRDACDIRSTVFQHGSTSAMVRDDDGMYQFSILPVDRLPGQVRQPGPMSMGMTIREIASVVPRATVKTRDDGDVFLWVPFESDPSVAQLYGEMSEVDADTGPVLSGLVVVKSLVDHREPCPS